MVTYYFVSMNKSVRCNPSGWIPQHELERISHGFLPAFGHDRIPSDWVQIVLRQIVNRNTVGPTRRKKIKNIVTTSTNHIIVTGRSWTMYVCVCVYIFKLN